MKVKRFVILILSLFIIAGCKSAPTKVFETTPAKKNKADEISADTVIIDARPNFDYELSHINGSINMRWEDFTQRESPFEGLFEKDLFGHARRLARMGIGPETPVLIVGRGAQGQGEEGRLAWTLKFLGLKNVRFMHIDAFNRPQTEREAPPRDDVPIWKPELDDSLIMTRAEFLKKTMAPRSPTGGLVIMDVRPASEYLGKTPSPMLQRPPDIGAINVPWTEFISPQGRTNAEIKTRLASVGITPDREIICIANKGAESATATLVLRELGYSKATNYSGGYAELMARKK